MNPYDQTSLYGQAWASLSNAQRISEAFRRPEFKGQRRLMNQLIDNSLLLNAPGAGAKPTENATTPRSESK